MLIDFPAKYFEIFNNRNIDVSSIKELSSRWFGEKGLAPEKKSNHRALDDIIESVNELKWYKENLFKE